MGFNRITSDEVIRAYQEFKVTPASCLTTATSADGKSCMCPAAVLHRHLRLSGDALACQIPDPMVWLVKRHGNSYSNGFINAVDNGGIGSHPKLEEADFKLGFSDGLQVWADVLEACILGRILMPLHIPGRREVDFFREVYQEVNGPIGATAPA